ncbi:hypothetical protein VTN77DRAFT_6653 [Rasamsonia byssochlamydoides]|uniref:uncharacterized protein n=1 Tax=Rasamsonia byssochlamydoides TaxID=89139 RepID=UPI0037420F5E
MISTSLFTVKTYTFLIGNHAHNVDHQTILMDGDCEVDMPYLCLSAEAVGHPDPLPIFEASILNSECRARTCGPIYASTGFPTTLESGSEPRMPIAITKLAVSCFPYVENCGLIFGFHIGANFVPVDILSN